MEDRYVIGLDFGTLSGRAVLVSCENGDVLADDVKEYAHKVMSDYLPDKVTGLKGNCALQHPRDYLDVMKATVKNVMKKSGINKDEIIGISMDFTSCTILPIDENAVPLCMKKEYEHRPHAYAKLWKHHGAQTDADIINDILKDYHESDKERFAGKVSPELLIPKIMEIIREDYEIYEKADEILEAGDWLTRVITNSEKRSGSMAGYKAWWLPEKGYPESEFFALLDSKLEHVVKDKLGEEVCPIGNSIGNLTDLWAEYLGLLPGTPVGASIIDSHAGVPGSGIYRKGQMMLVAGTSSVIIALSDKPFSGKGICGTYKGGIIPDYYALESGLAAVGDMLQWFIQNSVPAEYFLAADRNEVTIHEYLSMLAGSYKAGENGLIALDWWNGNKTPHVDGELSGMLIGISMKTKPEEIYRALIESTAYGTRMIVETMKEAGIEIDEITASGGIAAKNPFFMQIYADVLGIPIGVAASSQTAALGSAIYAAVAAGASEGGYDTIEEAVAAMSKTKEKIYFPIADNVIKYNQIYREYRILTDYFGPEGNAVLKKLSVWKSETTN
ncbi:ribulokinase [Kineothrix sedimenti]|uniref:Ribulokinase n=1 Tax=Kineothrix sedimenti TaxID=3123317 RepID=A0ABZ3F0L6_9FIRM